MATLIENEREADRQPEAHRKPSNEPLPLRYELEAASASGGVRGVFQTIARALLAPFLLAVALLGFLWVMADLTWYRMRSFYKGRPQPRGLWDI